MLHVHIASTLLLCTHLGFFQVRNNEIRKLHQLLYRKLLFPHDCRSDAFFLINYQVKIDLHQGSTEAQQVQRWLKSERVKEKKNCEKMKSQSMHQTLSAVKQILANGLVKYLHMTHFMHFKGPILTICVPRNEKTTLFYSFCYIQLSESVY